MSLSVLVGWLVGLLAKHSDFMRPCRHVLQSFLLMRTPICARESRDFPAFFPLKREVCDGRMRLVAGEHLGSYHLQGPV